MRHNTILRFMYDTGVKYPAPSNLSYSWNFGVFGLVILVSQIISGILLVMHYTPDVDLAFISVEHLSRDVNAGWILRYIHANGASLFFIAIYAHILRGLYYGSYLSNREWLWVSGVVIFLLMIITAFLGYILPWGQMSLWGATVITNLASTIPTIGDYIVLWLWGGFSVDNPTLTKFFSLHYILPFVILTLVGMHVLLLHSYGSSNPLGIDYNVDRIVFAPYYTLKDFFSILLFLGVLFTLVDFMPNALGHPDNYIPANPDITPEHIVPEWYFLPFYAILRSIPDKSLGVLALLASIIVLMILPFLHKSYLRTSHFKPVYNVVVFTFATTCVLLGYIGGKPIETPYLEFGQILTALYFLFFLVMPILEHIDFKLIEYSRDLQNKKIVKIKKEFEPRAIHYKNAVKWDPKAAQAR